MDIKKINLYLEQYGSYYKADQVMTLRQALASVPEKYADDVLATKLLNPTHMQIASAFGGVLGWDRFLLGDKTMGFVKMFLLGGCGIVALIDLFTIQNKTKDYNYERILKCIASVGNPIVRPQVPVAPPSMVQAPAAPVFAAQPVAKAPTAPVAPAVVPPVAPAKAPVAPAVVPPVAAPVAVANAPAPAAKPAEAEAKPTEPAAPAEPKAPEAPTMAPTPPKKNH